MIGEYKTEALKQYKEIGSGKRNAIEVTANLQHVAVLQNFAIIELLESIDRTARQTYKRNDTIHSTCND